MAINIWFLGAIFVATMIFSIPHISVALTNIAGIIDQILISMTIDHFGFWAIPTIPLNWYRIIGLLLMLSGLFFIYRGSANI